MAMPESASSSNAFGRIKSASGTRSSAKVLRSVASAKKAQIGVAHHRIAGVKQIRVRVFGLPHKRGHHRGSPGLAHEARQNGRCALVDPALGKARQDLVDQIRVQQAAAHRGIVRMVRQQRSRHFDHFDPASTHRPGSRGISDMAPCNLALDRDDDGQGLIGAPSGFRTHAGVSSRRVQSSVRPLASRASAMFRHRSGRPGRAAKAVNAVRLFRSR